MNENTEGDEIFIRAVSEPINECGITKLAIKQHPSLTFVETGTSADFGKRHGWDKRDEWIGSDNEWMYAIDGHPGHVIAWSEESARESAEEELFLRDPGSLKIRERELRDASQLDALLALVELRGYWRGKVATEARTREILRPLREAIDRVAR